MLAELADKPTNGLTVVSTFACGGGSSMGYKRAGFRVVCANDIDPEMAWHYQRNLHPPNYVLAPIKELMSRWPRGLSKEVDLLDGSPPCSTFSMAGSREKAWGKKKHFREGQAEQVLDDLFFDFLDVAEALRPRAIVAENVAGMVRGNARGYVRMIFERLRCIGYKPQLFLVNAARCGVPQARERVFFCAQRDDLNRPALRLEPDSPIVSAAEACADLVLTDDEIRETVPDNSHRRWWSQTTPGRNYQHTTKAAMGGEGTLFNYIRLHPGKPASTLTATHHTFAHWNECRLLSLREFIRLGSFPDDYFVKSSNVGKYMIGMSVPPKMSEAVAAAVRDQWLIA